MKLEHICILIRKMRLANSLGKMLRGRLLSSKLHNQRHPRTEQAITSQRAARQRLTLLKMKSVVCLNKISAFYSFSGKAFAAFK